MWFSLSPSLSLCLSLSRTQYPLSLPLSHAVFLSLSVCLSFCLLPLQKYPPPRLFNHPLSPHPRLSGWLPGPSCLSPASSSPSISCFSLGSPDDTARSAGDWLALSPCSAAIFECCCCWMSFGPRVACQYSLGQPSTSARPLKEKNDFFLFTLTFYPKLCCWCLT